jgi:carbonic anhydrase
MKFQIVQDQEATLRADVELVREFSLLPQGVEVAGAIYDVHTGKLNFIC